MIGTLSAVPTFQFGSPPSVLEYPATVRARGCFRSGSAVMKRTLPPIAPSPYNVPCGPRSTWTRSTSKVLATGAQLRLSTVNTASST